ncbi:MAG: SH3 domain-containing protein [Anaerolineae bacterium]
MKIKVFLWSCLIILMVSPLLAAEADCPVLVRQALDATNSLCEKTGRNEACYGNVLLQARPQVGVANFTFDQPGNIANVGEIQSLRLSPMSPDKGEWGVALMRLQANLPASSEQLVTMLSFGDVKLENAAPVPTTLTMQVLGRDFINVRTRANVNAGVVAVLEPGQTVTAVERLNDNSWVRIDVPDSGERGWVHASLLQTDSDIKQLNVSGSTAPSFRPMQSFYFESGADEPACTQVPRNGLIIQTPEGAGEVRFWVNEVKVSMGSTIYFQAQPGSNMTIAALEGHATVEVDGVIHTAVAGTQVQVKLDEQMHPASPPSMPEAYSMSDVENLPVNNLGREITIHPPLSDDEIAVLQNNQSNNGNGNNNSGQNGNDANTCVPPCDAPASSDPANSPAQNCPGNSCNSNGNGNGNNQNCPGNSCNAPGNNGGGNGNGNNDNCPGNSCNAPGHNK